MALDITLENAGVVYECGLSEQNSDGRTNYLIDIRIPGHGILLSTQLHGIEFRLDQLTGRYSFYSNSSVIPAEIKSLETPLNQALQNLLGKPAT